MSRIGKKPISIPKGVTVAIHTGELEVKGAKGVLKTPIPRAVAISMSSGSSSLPVVVITQGTSKLMIVPNAFRRRSSDSPRK